MTRNKVIDKLFKKLLKAAFTHGDINELLALEPKFRSFDLFIYYLFSLSLKNFDDKKTAMAKAASEYLEYLVITHKLEPPSVDKLNAGQNLSIQEVSLLGAKGFDGLQQFSFDAEENCYICLNDDIYKEYKDIINVRLAFRNQSFLESFINQRIINHSYNKILIFKKLHDQYDFLGFYKILDISQIYQNEFMYPSIILAKIESDNDGNYLEYKNLLKRDFTTSFEALKDNIRNLIIVNKNDTYRFLNIIETNHCHYLLLYNLVQHVLTISDINLLEVIKTKYITMLKQVLMLPVIIPDETILEEFYLTLFTNSYETIYGMQISSDFRNNIYIIINENNLQQNDREIVLRFVKSFNEYFFDLDINKKMFNTVIDNTAIYLFVKEETKITYYGLYKVSKLKIGRDLQNLPTPMFTLRALNIDEKFKHLNYISQTIVTNQYKNAFIDFIKPESTYGKWLRNTTLITPVKINHDNDLFNSFIYKFNWVIRRCLQNINNENYMKYWAIFYKFNSQHLLNVINCVSYNYKYIIEHNLMQPWTIAYQMTKQNYSNKHLFEIAYMDYYETKEKKINYCLAVIKKEIKA